ncbi:G5 domain-containing protein [Streptococcus loxodontisalivarius]|uniref:LPXTG-motif cell wall-anchored protein n=1 Tax=Streptococcus loxodontisalivarius TaxID=1349415 RepID=A0ABS2PTF4_9STRE|nr:G5 domain-containing protein [Streptococcus loxodontisalivarius]MBM7643322.1 LPXTG-motif cell wall-anchored protein [Streptococcus loxodontisalivarius]
MTFGDKLNQYAIRKKHGIVGSCLIGSFILLSALATPSTALAQSDAGSDVNYVDYQTLSQADKNRVQTVNQDFTAQANVDYTFVYAKDQVASQGNQNTPTASSSSSSNAEKEQTLVGQFLPNTSSQDQALLSLLGLGILALGGVMVLRHKRHRNQLILLLAFGGSVMTASLALADVIQLKDSKLVLSGQTVSADNISGYHLVGYFTDQYGTEQEVTFTEATGNKTSQETTSTQAEQQTTSSEEAPLITKVETQTEAISYGKQTIQDPLLPKGQTKIVQEGKDGQLEKQVQVSYQDGKIVSSQVLSETVTQKAQDEITAVGTLETSKGSSEQLDFPVAEVTVKDETVTENIAYSSKTVQDPSLAKGETKVLQAGQNGSLTKTLRHTYINGQLISTDTISETTTQAAQDEIIAVGTLETDKGSSETVTPKEAVITTSDEVTTSSIAYTSQTVEDPTLPAGQTKIIQAGVTGIESKTIRHTYVDGQLASSDLIGQTITQAPVSEIIAIGTKVEETTQTDKGTGTSAELPVATITTSDESQTTALPFNSQTVEDPTLPKGQTKVIQTGQTGSLTQTYRHTYINGQLATTELVSETITQSPVSEIIAIGTLETANGSGQTSELPEAQLTYQEETQTKTIPHGQETVEDASLAKGETKVIQAGQDGIETITLRHVYLNGELVTTETLSQEITQAAQVEIIAVGTKEEATTTTELVTEQIAGQSFQTETRENPLLEEGQTNTLQEGQDGYVTITYQVTSDQTGQVLSKLEVARQEVLPISKIIEVGTLIKKKGDAESTDLPIALVTSKDEESQTPIAFTKRTVEDPLLEKGQTKVTQVGQDGVLTTVTRNTYIDGQLASSEVVSSTVTTEPIEEIIAVGTLETDKGDSTSDELPEAKITSEDVTETQTIAFTKRTVEDPLLEKGQTKVTQVGQDGVLTTVTRNTYIDGQLASSEVISSTVTTEPVEEITAVGTLETDKGDSTSDELPEAKITSEDVTETQTIAFTKRTVEDPLLEKGQTKVTQVGQDGVLTTVTRNTYIDGQLASSEIISSTVTTEPIEEITAVGTLETDKGDSTSDELPEAKITSEDVTETQTIAFTKRTVEDPLLEKGQTKVTQVGQDGVLTTVTRNTYIDGQLASSEVISSTVTTEPIEEITAVGTLETDKGDSTSDELPEAKITSEDVVTTRAIPYTKKTVEDPSMLAGESKVTQVGQDGVETTITRNTYIDGQLADSQIISTEISKEAVEEITTVGTLETITETVEKRVNPVAFQTIEQKNNSLRRNVRRTAIEGVDGYTTETYTVVKTKDGQILSETLISSVETAAINQVIEIGTAPTIEIKNITSQGLYKYENGQEEHVLSLSSDDVADTSNYYARIQTEDLREMLIPVTSISDNGDGSYAVNLDFTELTTFAGNDKPYTDGYSFTVAKTQTPTESNVFVSFAELVAAMKNNLSGNYILAADVSASEVNSTDATYIPGNFTGTFTSSYQGKQYSIVDLAKPLFENLKGAKIQDLVLSDVAINSSSDSAAALALTASSSSKIQHVAVEGNITAVNNVAGLINTLSSASTLSDVAFMGTITATGAGRGTANVAGLVGKATDGGTLIEKGYVDATITATSHTNNTRIAGLAAVVNQGSNGAATVKTSYATGSLINAGDDKLQVSAGVASSWANGFVNNNVTAVKVTNGTLFYGDSAYATSRVTDNYYITDLSEGTSTLYAKGLSIEDGQAKVVSFGNTAKNLISSASVSTSLDYLSLNDSQASRLTAYKNMEKIIPFYDRDTLVEYGNLVDSASNIATKEIASVTPLKDGAIASDLSQNDINQIMIRYTDGTIETLAVSFDKAYTNDSVRQYKITGTDLIYTPEVFVSDHSDIISQVSAELKALAYASDDNYKTLGITSESDPAKKISKLYLQEAYEKVQENIESYLNKLLSSDKAINTLGGATDDYIADYIKENKSALLLGLSYLVRWYGFDFNKIGADDLLLYAQDFYGKSNVEQLEWLVNFGKTGFSNLDPQNNITTYASSLASVTDEATLFDFLESHKELFDNSYATMNDWFKAHTTAYIVEKSSEEYPDQDVAVYNRLKAASSEQNGVLPLLTAREGIYIITTVPVITYGMYDVYLDMSLKESDPTSYATKVAELKERIQKYADMERAHFDAWFRILPSNIDATLFRTMPNWDSYSVRGNWLMSDSATTTNDAMQDFFFPIGRGKTQTAPASAYANGTSTFFIYSLLSDYTISIFTHETTHNADGRTYLYGYGRREGLGAEQYAQAYFQSPTGYSNDYFALNLIFDWTGTAGETSKSRYYALSPERYQNAQDVQEYTQRSFDIVYTLEAIEAELIAEQTTENKQKLLRKMEKSYDKDSSGNDAWASDTYRSLTTEEAESLKTIEDFVKADVASVRHFGSSNASGKISRGSYQAVSMFAGMWGENDNELGSPGDLTFRRTSYELLAELGYEKGLIPYASNQLLTAAKAAGNSHLTDSYIFEQVLKPLGYTSWDDFKIKKYTEHKAAAQASGSLKPVTVQWNGKPNVLTSYDDIKNLMRDAMQKDLAQNRLNSNSLVKAVEAAIYNDYLLTTNDFRESIYTNQ